jgi:P-type Ca2+ transporter type 2C
MTDPGRGLTAEEVAQARAQNGANRLTELRGRSLWSLLRDGFDDRTIKILVAAAFAVLTVDVIAGGAYVDGLAILAAVLIAGLVRAYNDVRAQAEFKSLQASSEARQVRVVRDGEVGAISLFDLVVGDVLELEAGDKVPADACLVATPTRPSALEVDESMHTGESSPAHKDVVSDATLRAGTLVVSGSAVAIVTAVGDGTEYGRLRAQLAVAHDPTPLQRRLTELANRIGLLGVGAALAILVTLSIVSLAQGRLTADLAGLRHFLDLAVLGVTIVVVAVPEGLPLAVTLSLAYSVVRMAKDHNLVRRLVACETMGAAEIICTDKTGTLTENRMSAERLLLPGRAGDEIPLPGDVAPWSHKVFAEIAAINSTAHLLVDASGDSRLGSPTETALLELTERLGGDYRALRAQAQVIRACGFNAATKTMSTAVAGANGPRLLVKGGAEILLTRCSHVLDKSGARALLANERTDIESTLRLWGTLGLRPLALAYRELGDEAALAEATEILEHELVFVAAVGLGDPLRAEVPAAIAACRAAGVEIKVVTGDHQATAEAVAHRLDLLSPTDLVMSGTDFRARDDEALRPLLGQLRVLARATPDDKLRLVRLLKDEGHVVAVTGDGTNDGPALRHADVGLAMGRSGTDVAREASDIVLLDDSFGSVVKALHWGRAVFENIQRFLQFQITVSMVALATAFTAGLFGLGTPLQVVQLLWVNLIMDTLAALALATEAPRPELLSRPPHGRHAPLVTSAMWLQIAVVGGAMCAVMALTLFTDILSTRGGPTYSTFVFNLFVWLQIGNLFNCRATRLDSSASSGLLAAPFFWVILGGIILVQILVVEIGGAFFKTVPLSLAEWAQCATLGGSVIVLRSVLRRIAARSSLVQGRADVEVPALLEWMSRPVSQAHMGLVGGAGAVAMCLGLALRGAEVVIRPLGFAAFAGGLAAAALWLWSRRGQRSLPFVTSARRHAAASVGLALVLAAMANYVAARHYSRIDLTAAKKYALSEQTLGILSRLKSPLRLTTILRDGGTTTEIKDLLAEYGASNPLVALHHIDPDRDPAAIDALVDRAGLKHKQATSVVLEYDGRARLISSGELFVRKYEYKGGRRVVVRGETPAFRGEEAVSSAIAALMNTTLMRACFLLGDGERSSNDFGNQGIAFLRDELRREGYAVTSLTLPGSRLTRQSCDVAIQAGPTRSLAPEAIALLDSYLTDGGKWLLLLEPWQAGGLDDLLKKWGVGVRPGFVADPKQNVAGLGATTLAVEAYQDHPVTASLRGIPLVLPYAASVRRVETVRALAGANLALTGKNAILETNRQATVAEFNEGEDGQGEYAVATAVDEPPNLYAADGRREPARLIVVGDTDFATNVHLSRGANTQFLLNAVDWLARREELIAVRAKTPETPRLTLSATSQSGLFWLSMGALPGFVGLLGAVVALRRRS